MKAPAPSVAVVRAGPPGAPRASTVTPGSTRPVVSVTVPETAPSWRAAPSWARAAPGASAAPASERRTTANARRACSIGTCSLLRLGREPGSAAPGGAARRPVGLPEPAPCNGTDCRCRQFGNRSAKLVRPAVPGRSTVIRFAPPISSPQHLSGLPARRRRGRASAERPAAGRSRHPAHHACPVGAGRPRTFRGLPGVRTLRVFDSNPTGPTRSRCGCSSRPR